MVCKYCKGANSNLELDGFGTIGSFHPPKAYMRGVAANDKKRRPCVEVFVDGAWVSVLMDYCIKFGEKLGGDA